MSRVAKIAVSLYFLLSLLSCSSFAACGHSSDHCPGGDHSHSNCGDDHDDCDHSHESNHDNSGHDDHRHYISGHMSGVSGVQGGFVHDGGTVICGLHGPGTGTAEQLIQPPEEPDIPRVRWPGHSNGTRVLHFSGRWIE